MIPPLFVWHKVQSLIKIITKCAIQLKEELCEEKILKLQKSRELLLSQKVNTGFE